MMTEERTFSTPEEQELLEALDGLERTEQMARRIRKKIPDPPKDNEEPAQ